MSRSRRRLRAANRALKASARDAGEMLGKAHRDISVLERAIDSLKRELAKWKPRIAVDPFLVSGDLQISVRLSRELLAASVDRSSVIRMTSEMMMLKLADEIGAQS